MRKRATFVVSCIAVTLGVGAYGMLALQLAREQAAGIAMPAPVNPTSYAGVPQEVASRLVAVHTIDRSLADKYPSSDDRVVTVEELLSRLDEFWTQVDSFTVWSRVQDSAFSPWRTFTQISAERPWKVAIVPAQAAGPLSTVRCDGSMLSVECPSLKIQLLGETGGTLEPLLANPFLLMQSNNLMPVSKESLFPLELFTISPSQFLAGNAIRTEFVGREAIEGVEVDRLRIHLENCHRDLLIAATGPPVPLMLDDTSSGPDYYFSHWEINCQIPPGVFQVASTSGFARKMVDLAAPGRGLIGKPAPDFTFEQFDGSTESISSFLGKQAVILEFWSKSCGPCLRELGRLSALASEPDLADVQFLALNSFDSATQAADFARSKDWSRFARIDPGGQGASLHGVTGIPHVVVIDREGMVRAVRVGVIPNPGDWIRRALSIGQP